MCDALTVCKNEAREEADFFDDYDLTYMTGEKELSSGANGKAIQVLFEKDGKKGKAVMKIVNSEKGKMADNLWREGLVGLIGINQHADLFPCFIRTYGLYEEASGSSNTVGKIGFQKLRHEKLMRLSYDEMCETAGHQAIMIEYVKGKPIKEFYKEFTFQKNLFPVVFQIYYALLCLGSRYTHYDLHTGNVMISEPKEGECVRFEYVMPGESSPTVFYSNYVAKLIDYGRNYDDSMKDIEADLKKAHKCNSLECGDKGERCGFRNLQNPKHKHLGYRRSNTSHDLRLLNYVMTVVKRKLFKKANLSVGGSSEDFKHPSVTFKYPSVTFSENGFSTKEVLDSGLPDRINNVRDAGEYLATIVDASNDKFKSVPVYGTLKVDGRNPWSFELGTPEPIRRHPLPFQKWSAKRMNPSRLSAGMRPWKKKKTNMQNKTRTRGGTRKREYTW